jgi:hypothetical protein
MTNPYLINVGDIFPNIINIILDIYEQKDFWDKNPKFKDVGNRIFGYAIMGQEFPTGIAPDEQIQDIAQRIRENFKEFNKFDGEVYDPSMTDLPRWARFVQNNIAENKKEQILNLLPDEIKQHNVTYMMQIADLGQYMMVHRDHERTSGLFYLLTDPDSETRFYKPKTDFKIYDDVRTVSINDVELDHAEIIQKGSWYIFNHSAYHSVHALDQSKPVNRVSFVIEFVDLPFDELVKLIEYLKAQNKI